MIGATPYPEPASSVPECPRCGYDMSGECASWKDFCPLDGICPECGLTFPWHDLLDPLRGAPPWFFEHTRGGWFVTFTRTLARAVRPRRFWREIRMQYGVRTFRLALIAAWCLLLVHLIIMLSTWGLSAAFFRTWRTWGMPMPPPPKWMPVGLPPWLSDLAGLLWPYSQPRFVAALLPGSSPLTLITAAQFMLMPLVYLALPITLRRSRVRRVHLLRIGAYSLVGLPLVLFPVCVAAFLTRHGLTWGGSGRLTELLINNFGALPLLGLAWLSLFWWCAAHRYLRIPHAPAVVGVMALVSLLASTAITAFADPGFADNPVVQWLLVLR